MQSPVKSSFKFFIACLVLSSINMSNSLAQSNDSYLQLLEGEANNSSIDKKTQAKKNNKTKLIPVSSSNDGNIPTGLSLEDFMKNLKVNYIGTYFFAKRLSAKQMDEMYTFYQNNNDPQAIRTKIIEISKKN